MLIAFSARSSSFFPVPLFVLFFPSSTSAVAYIELFFLLSHRQVVGRLQSSMDVLRFVELVRLVERLTFSASLPPALYSLLTCSYPLYLDSYVWGFVMILKSPNLATYTVGSVSVAIGSTSLTMITTILTADLINLQVSLSRRDASSESIQFVDFVSLDRHQWRAFAQGALSSFYIVTPFFTGQIANALSTNNNWRWGYGMYVWESKRRRSKEKSGRLTLASFFFCSLRYAIIIPFVMLPAITVLLWLDHRASKIEQVSQGQFETEKHVEVHVPASAPKAPWTQRFMHVLSELDAFGLLLLGFGWSLVSCSIKLRTRRRRNDR